jgi:hypothetical protein
LLYRLYRCGSTIVVLVTMLYSIDRKLRPYAATKVVFRCCNGLKPLSSEKAPFATSECTVDLSLLLLEDNIHSADEEVSSASTYTPRRESFSTVASHCVGLLLLLFDSHPPRTLLSLKAWGIALPFAYMDRLDGTTSPECTFVYTYTLT